MKEVADGVSVKSIGLVFRKIEDNEVIGWEHQFSGIRNHNIASHISPNAY